jgi:hypothetical protein
VPHLSAVGAQKQQVEISPVGSGASCAPSHQLPAHRLQLLADWAHQSLGGAWDWHVPHVSAVGAQKQQVDPAARSARSIPTVPPALVMVSLAAGHQTLVRSIPAHAFWSRWLHSVQLPHASSEFCHAEQHAASGCWLASEGHASIKIAVARSGYLRGRANECAISVWYFVVFMSYQEAREAMLERGGVVGKLLYCQEDLRADTLSG